MNGQRRCNFKESEEAQDPPEVDFGEKEQVMAPKHLRIVLQNIQSFDTVGNSALQDDATVHVWPEAKIMARGQGLARKVFGGSGSECSFLAPHGR